MIKTKQDLKNCLDSDNLHYPKVVSAIRRLKHSLVTNPINCQSLIYRYIRCMRYAEFHYNNSAFAGKLGGANFFYHTALTLLYFYRLRKLSYKTGFQLPPGTCGPGLMIYHYGYLIVNGKVRIGKNAILYPGIEIGDKDGTGCPVIGDNVMICAGAKIFGPLKIGNNVTIAANAVVTKDVPDNAIVGGVPAKILKMKL